VRLPTGFEKLRRGGLVLLLLLAHACAPGESPQATRSAIFGGDLDVAHPGVFALLDAQGALACSATVIATGGGWTTVLTAAHCFNSTISGAVRAGDFNDPDRIDFVVSGTRVHPSFERSTGAFDFGIAYLQGQTDPSDVLPILDPSADRLAPGDAIDFVGFGVTDGANTVVERRHVAGAVAAVSDTSLSYDQRTGGPCHGDSGGPALIRVDDHPFIAGVTSFGDPSCTDHGVSVRASAGFAFARDAAVAPGLSAADIILRIAPPVPISDQSTQTND
jgi:hypothetical protein